MFASYTAYMHIAWNRRIRNFANRQQEKNPGAVEVEALQLMSLVSSASSLTEDYGQDHGNIDYPESLEFLGGIRRRLVQILTPAQVHGE